MKKKDPSRFFEPKRATQKEIGYRIELERYFAHSIGTNVEKLQNFAKYVPTQDLRKFVCRYELFKKILQIHGAIVECGVLFGGGLMTWAQLSEIFEPLNHTRNVIGFDTFSGFVSLSHHDKTARASQSKIGGLSIDAYSDLLESIRLYDKGRFLGHIQKVKLIKGDIKKTLPQYLRDNPHLVVSLLWLDFDLYEPTRCALKYLFPRIPRGGIIAFDELSHEMWPGETIAVMKTIGLNKLKIQRLPFGGTLSYAVIK